ncbi:MAG: hypothetical protein RL318_1339 [Fibrobacterota bacterium]|jgi:hypothetical protein
MKRFLSRLGQHILQGITLAGSLVWLVYLGWIRDPMLDWGIILAGFVLSAALGWWPLISLGVAVLLELVVYFYPGLPAPRQIMEEIAVFWALGLGIGVVARSFFQHHESLLLDETHPLKVVTPAREAGRRVVPSPQAAPQEKVPAPQTALEETLFSAPNFRPNPSPSSPPAPIFAPPQPTAPRSLPETPASLQPRSSLPAEQAPLPGQPSISLTAGTPLRTQEIDIGDFRAWVASQQAASPGSSLADSGDIPSGLLARRSSSNSSSVPLDSALGAPAPATEAAAPETDLASPHALLLEWYNQFSAWPWPEGALQRRYPGGRWMESAAHDVRDALDLHRAGATHQPPSPHFDLEDVQFFLRCEQLFLLRRQQLPDLHTLTPQLPVLDWLPIYQEARRPARGGEARIQGLSPDAMGHDASRALAGRPDALLEVGGHAEVVTVFRPSSVQEPLTSAGALGAAQLAVAASLGIPLSGGLALVLLPALGDRRNQPRVNVVEDLATEFRRLDGALDRMRRILEGNFAPKPQVRSGVCDACGRRHGCPSYVGQRPRLNLTEPPAFLSRFQP